MNEPEPNFVEIPLEPVSGPQPNAPAVPSNNSNIITAPNGSVLAGGAFQSPNFVIGVSGWRILASGDVEFNDGTFRGALTATTIDIGGADATSFHVDIDGNLWLGDAAFATAPFKVSNAGVLTATGATITGTITATTGTIGGFDVGADYIRDVANSMGLASTVTGGDDVRGWAGATFANRATAPFRYTEAGAVVATNISITSGDLTASLLNAGSVDTVELVDDAVTTAKIAALAITTAELGALAVTTAKIAADAVTAVEIATGAVGTDQLAALAVTTANIAAGAVTAVEIANATISTAKIALDAIDATLIAAGAVGSTELAAGAVIAGKITAGTIVAADIAASTITGNEIAATTITAANIAAGTITTSEIAADTIVAGNIAANAITSSELAANSVIAGKIAALTIVAADIAAGTITGAKIAATTITASNIAALTITAAELAANTITAAKIASGTITSTEIAANTIVAGDIAANTITAGELSTSITYAGSIVIDTAGLIRSGQTAYDTGTGWWIGNDGGTPKLSIGVSTGAKMTWSGATLRFTKRVVTVTQSATPAIDTDITDVASITGLAQAITSMTSSLTGTPNSGDTLVVQITDNGTARAITWGASFASTLVTLPATTSISAMLRIGFQWNTVTSKWDCIALA